MSLKNTLLLSVFVVVLTVPSVSTWERHGEKCSHGMIWNGCPSACSTGLMTCEGFLQHRELFDPDTPIICTQQCLKPRCECAPGQVLGPDGFCVKTSFCIKDKGPDPLPIPITVDAQKIKIEDVPKTLDTQKIKIEDVPKTLDTQKIRIDVGPIFDDTQKVKTEVVPLLNDTQIIRTEVITLFDDATKFTSEVSPQIDTQPTSQEPIAIISDIERPDYFDKCPPTTRRLFCSSCREGPATCEEYYLRDNKEYQERKTKTGCQVTCYFGRGATPVCECLEESHVKGPDGRCIAPELCPPDQFSDPVYVAEQRAKCTGGMVWARCGDRCDLTCDKSRYANWCQETDCGPPRCQCPRGQRLFPDGTCKPEYKCWPETYAYPKIFKSLV